MKMHIRRYAVVLSLLIALAACKHSGSHLPPATMKKVLLDIHLAEAYSSMVKDSLHKGGSKNYDSLSVYYKDIFTHYNITRQQFTESIDWYKDHPVELDSMYADMMPLIAKMQAKAPEQKRN